MPQHRESLSVVIPAYNEEAYIENCITTLEAVLREITDDFEVIVVNDGSQDRTRRSSRSSAARGRTNVFEVSLPLVVASVALLGYAELAATPRQARDAMWQFVRGTLEP
jgi:cellulose synthase/poly-beta-1,6-N-acetylglucosamine synthase-like glycosyltransferase